MRVPGRVALVTGGGSGIGRAVALGLVSAGYLVALAGRRRKALLATVHESGALRDRMLAVPADVKDPESMDSLFGEVATAFGRIDLLFNNAGASMSAVPFDELTYEEWREALDVNVTGAFLCAQRAFRQMKKQSPHGGGIINNGSISTHAPRPRSAPYTATKHAITGLTQSLFLDGRGFDIACGQIDIGNAATDMTVDSPRAPCSRTAQDAQNRASSFSTSSTRSSTWPACPWPPMSNS